MLTLSILVIGIQVKVIIAPAWSAAQAVGDTLGGAMSQDAKKALQGIMDIADIGMKACQAIEAVSNAASISVSTTASTAEKASVILMAIAAISVIMETVNLFMSVNKRNGVRSYDKVRTIQNKLPVLTLIRGNKVGCTQQRIRMEYKK